MGRTRITMKRTIRLTESDLHRIIEESVNSVIKEHYEDRPEEIGKLPEDNYYGGGLPDAYFNEDDFVDTGITENQIAGLEDSMDYIADIANNVDLDTDLLFQACDCIEKFLTNNCA